MSSTDRDRDSLLSDYFDFRKNRNVDVSNVLTFDTKKDSFGNYYVDCGTREMILENLKGLNPLYLSVFLDTFILYMTPSELLDHLIERYALGDSDQKINQSSSVSTLHDSKTNSVINTQYFSEDIKLRENVVDDKNTQRSLCVPQIKTENTNSVPIDRSKLSGNWSQSQSQLETAKVFQYDCDTIKSVDMSSYSKLGHAAPPKVVVVKLLRQWVSKYFEDFIRNPPVLEKLEQFLANRETELDKKESLWRLINLVTVTIKDQKEAWKKKDSQEDSNREQTPWDVMKHKEVADVLTAIELILFKNLSIRELLEYVFSKNEDKRSICPTVCDIIENSTSLTLVVETQILKYPNSRVRAVEIEAWIAVINDLMELKNYSSIVAILGALNATAVDRLAKTKRKVAPKRLKQKSEIEKKLGIENYYDNLRVYLDNNVHVEAIPFLGSYMTIFDRLKQNGLFTADQKINFKTCRHISRILQSIQSRQKCFICQMPDQRKINYMKKILKIPSLTSKELFELSYKNEPKASQK